jgi:hypothetical protein
VGGGGHCECWLVGGGRVMKRRMDGRDEREERRR